MLWNYSLSELKRGYVKKGNNLVCILCGKVFERGKIYKMEGELYDALGAICFHNQKRHISIAQCLLNQELSLTGITESQCRILRLVLEGNSDQEIAKRMGIAPSTVRNHRFKLREKEKQAKLFLALMDSLEEETKSKIEKTSLGIIKEIHPSATMIDERYNITEREEKKTLETYFNSYGALKQFPVKEKKKIIVLREIIKNFKTDTIYSEPEVNRILSRIYQEDVPTIRRALIAYGFMERSTDCKIYRVKE